MGAKKCKKNRLRAGRESRPAPMSMVHATDGTGRRVSVLPIRPDRSNADSVGTRQHGVAYRVRGGAPGPRKQLSSAAPRGTAASRGEPEGGKPIPRRKPWLR